MRLLLILLLVTYGQGLTVYEPHHEDGVNVVHEDGEGERVHFSIETLDFRDFIIDDSDYSYDNIKDDAVASDLNIDIDSDDETVSYGDNKIKDSAPHPSTNNNNNDDEIDSIGIDIDANSIPEPPDHKQTAKMSRYLCHYSDWLAMATISTRGSLTGTPFASIFSYSDGPLGNSTGIPYFYMTNMDMSTHDLQKNSKASVTISLAQNGYCRVHSLDPEDPRCAHVILAGDVVKVPANSSEEAFAKEALFSRHPVMPDWPESHGWYFTKLNIDSVILLDFFGGAIDVPLQDYFNVVL
eukprot:TRINITY_DN3253_c0_g2_i5.p2 TRINITY_DN3253_c0_g2~~TRINITY_DN3253_c0_g2_i5.p2  ORF type:complete len:306 (+),score=92.24 TRINITY_DN3253_c0_g2_i5:31-918(+)